MTAIVKRQAVIDKYATIIGRNIYNQTLRDYCFKKHTDGNYYSDCSSSICYSYKEAGYGFGILNTAGIYQSSQLTTVDVTITDGVPDITKLRPGDMLEFAGSDASRPLKIGHVEMYCGNGTICGHGSGNPSYKDLVTYCKSRYNSWASGGWREGLVCVRRYIQDDAQVEYTLGWNQDTTGWYFADTKTTYYKSCFKTIEDHKYYFGSDGYAYQSKWLQLGDDWYYFDKDCYMVCNSWAEVDGKWYWFNAAGVMVTKTWYQYNSAWYYLGPDGAMCQSQLVENSGKIYAVDADGKMITEPVTLTPDQDGALQYPGLA